MAIHWTHTESESAADALAAVERALAGGAEEARPAGAMDPQLLDTVRGDPYLAANLVTLHETWAVDPHRIVLSSRPGLAAAINGFQRLVRRATWWFALPQWLQVNAFHGAIVRTIASLVKDRHRLEQQLADIAGGHVLARTALLEQQILALREEQRALRERIAELEGKIGDR
jgi:hypothetical protein